MRSVHSQYLDNARDDKNRYKCLLEILPCWHLVIERKLLVLLIL